MSLYIYISSYWESTSNFQFLEHPLETASESWRLQVCGFEKGWFILSVLFHFKTIYFHSASKCLLVWVFELIVFYKILRCSMRLNSRYNRFIKCINIFKKKVFNIYVYIVLTATKFGVLLRGQTAFFTWSWPLHFLF